MNVNTADKVDVKENLVNRKPWLGKIKNFPSVKVSPPQQPSTLSIKVGDTVTTGEALR